MGANTKAKHLLLVRSSEKKKSKTNKQEQVIVLLQELLWDLDQKRSHQAMKEISYFAVV